MFTVSDLINKLIYFTKEYYAAVKNDYMFMLYDVQGKVLNEKANTA